MRQINWLVIHTTATRPSMDIGVKEVRQWHKQRGWSDVGYHYIIRRDGKVERGRAESRVGAHVARHNKDSLGISLVGGVSEVSLKPENNYTEAQWKSLEALLRKLSDKYPSANVTGHRDFPGVAKACPCFDAEPWAQTKGFKTKQRRKVDDKGLVEATQHELHRLGYHQVGKVDGMIGNRTRGAILAFQDDNGLDLDPKPTYDLLRKMKNAKPAHIDEARAKGTPKGSRIVTGANASMASGAAGLAVSAAGTAQETLDQAEGGVSAISRFTSLVGISDAVQPYLPFIGAAIFAIIIVVAWRIKSARVEDFRTGKTP